MSVGNSWPHWLDSPANQQAMRADECVREDYDVAQRVARERAAYRGVRQFVAKRWKARTVPIGSAGGWRWVVMDAEGTNVSPAERRPPRSTTPIVPGSLVLQGFRDAPAVLMPPGFRPDEAAMRMRR